MEIVEEIMKIHRSLPARPGIDEVEAAKAMIANVEKEDQARLDSISKQNKSAYVPEELLMVHHEMQRNMVYFNSKKVKKEAIELLDLEHVHCVFDELIQRASKCVSSDSVSNSSPRRPAGYYADKSLVSRGSFDEPSTSNSVSSSLLRKEPVKVSELVTRDDGYVKKAKSTFYPDGYGIEASISLEPQIVDSSLKPTTTSGICICYSSIQLSSLCFGPFFFSTGECIEMDLDVNVLSIYVFCQRTL